MSWTLLLWIAVGLVLGSAGYYLLPRDTHSTPSALSICTALAVLMVLVFLLVRGA